MYHDPPVPETTLPLLSDQIIGTWGEDYYYLAVNCSPIQPSCTVSSETSFGCIHHQSWAMLFSCYYTAVCLSAGSAGSGTIRLIHTVFVVHMQAPLILERLVSASPQHALHMDLFHIPDCLLFTCLPG